MICLLSLPIQLWSQGNAENELTGSSSTVICATVASYPLLKRHPLDSWYATTVEA